MRILRDYFNSAAGRIFLLLMLGVIAAVAVALFAADIAQRQNLTRLRHEWTAQQIANSLTLLNVSPAPQRDQLLDTGLATLWRAPADMFGTADETMTSRVSALAAGYSVTVEKAGPNACVAIRPARFDGRSGDCWLVIARLQDGAALRALHATPPLPPILGRLTDIVFLSVLGIGAAFLALPVSRLAARPLGRLARAAKDLGDNIDRPALPLRGPTEVIAASRAFNTMQEQLKATLRERTRMLASITHDLQTPLTRLRLRVEKVEDATLRERLIADIGAMQGLIEEGLEFARSSETTENWSVVDLTSLVESLVEDAVDMGHDARLKDSVAVDVRARPLALRRCLQNIIDNAIAYGDEAELNVERLGNDVMVRVLDRGPGIPSDELERVFEPFYRIEESRSRETGGSGLGLTIARTLANANGGKLSLANRPNGGIIATLILPIAMGEPD